MEKPDSHDEIMSELLDSPEAKKYWERTKFARAVAIQIVKFRAQNNLSQSALARAVGVSQPLIARLESGVHEPTMSTLRKLSRALGIRFSIDIHPVGKGFDGFPKSQEGADLLVTDGVEMLVLAS